MSKSICGANCKECPSKATCRGCAATNGCPFGKQCSIAKYILTHGMEKYTDFKKSLIDEINAVDIPGKDEVTELYPLVGHFVNLEYPLPNGGKVKFLKDDEMYLGTQIENSLDKSKNTCFGAIAHKDFVLLCKYGENCANPELIFYGKRFENA